MLWDDEDAKWDSGFWDSGPISNPNPRNKPMKRPTWFPRVVGAQITWLTNFKSKLPNHATTPLALVPADVTACLLDVDNAIYALQTYRGAVGTFPDAAHQRIEDALNNESIPGNIIWLDFAPPSPAPAGVSYGCLQRVFTFIVDKVQESPGYDAAIGADLGTEPPAPAAPDPLVVPEFDIREAAGGKAEVVWLKGPYDGVRLEFDLGNGVIQKDIDLRPNYTLNWLPNPGQALVIKVRLRYIYKGEDFGNWSEWKQWTLTGV